MGGNGFSSPMDIFDMFFGQAFGGRGGSRGGRRERRGKDVIHQLSVSLEELYKGAVRKLALQKNVICDKCEGKIFENLLQSCSRLGILQFGTVVCNSVVTWLAVGAL